MACDSLPLFAIYATLAKILLSIVAAGLYHAASQHVVPQDLTLSISHNVTSDCQYDAIIIKIFPVFIPDG